MNEQETRATEPVWSALELPNQRQMFGLLWVYTDSLLSPWYYRSPARVALAKGPG